MQTKHRDLHEKFSQTFGEDLVAKWEQMVAEWDVDPSKDNPYYEPQVGKWLVAVRYKFLH